VADSTPPDADALLQRAVRYSGEGISVRSLEQTIAHERAEQAQRVSALSELRARNEGVHSALADEMERLREVAGELGGRELGIWDRLRALFVDETEPRQSVEALLREQYRISERRLREAAEYADRLSLAERDLHDEIDRLNERVIESAHNEDIAAGYLLELESAEGHLRGRVAALGSGPALRRAQADLDRLHRAMAEHSTKLRIYATAEDRLAVLKERTVELARTIGHLRSDILQYVTAAGEKLDMVAGQIATVGVAVDAANVVLDLKRAVDAMGESLNHSTRFVSETQRYFRDHISTLVEDLDVYDTETREVLQRNLAHAEAVGEEGVEEALRIARGRRG